MTIPTLASRSAFAALALLTAATSLVNPLLASEPGLVAQGTFEGRSDHVTTGAASLMRTASGYVLVLEADFSLDGAPAPTIGFGNDGTFDTASEFTPLRVNEGFQAYALPASLDPLAYGEVYIWCADFSVPLGVATLD